MCVDPTTGQLRWGLDLVRQYGTTVPPWYAGQCPLIDRGTVVLAPGGRNALLLALDGQTGQALWQTPNPHAWKMTHSSVIPMEFAGQRMYLYCANNGVVGVSADTGAILWETTDWKISLATVPSPLVLEGGRIFLSRRLQRRQPDAATQKGGRSVSWPRPPSGSTPPSSAPPSTPPFYTKTTSMASGPTAGSFA